MPLTRPFSDTVRERAASDPAFRTALLTEALDCFLDNDVTTAKKMLRDYVNASIGFQELGRRVKKKPESLMRMLSAKGNPGVDNLAQLIAVLRRHAGVELHVQVG
jgi:DNA-binding phage protein